ncbi:hydroxymethylpyrimidine/phosphomethylpyrimidine kinase [Pedobacter cryoconitis]|uniref:bifunctional hydroxymethylpyrimidine kinase/phosphomethylpyrimidine kinase n=1 Tax=Pedobacter cryoconitis TaxID=188932 RepID=UPI0016202AEA|nr:bifunctional hydroxymethylpyrimidine kinase/phosphomethylpyrimidine kinase [Pedobacter cryoconitis]MBB6270510.1 hydroxymethylpyrimidine/phosphomethylpyrimidine kinase [Pedobacter cryoconitis]
MVSTERKYIYPSVLTIAGSDSGGGAGIQADLKAISALGCYGTSAITVVTAQNTLGVTDLHHLPAVIVTSQISAVLNDIKPHAIKIGMIGKSELVQAIYDTLNQFLPIPIILDPVMISTSGHRLTDENTIGLMKTLLFPITTLLTPNLDEAAALAGIEISTVAQMKTAAKKILNFGCNAVLIKGGHLNGNKLCDIYLDKTGREFSYENDKIFSQNTHGTGCTLSSAIAAFIARGLEITVAIQNAESYVHQAIDQGMNVFTGQGKGPLNHFHDPIPLIKLNPDLKI